MDIHLIRLLFLSRTRRHHHFVLLLKTKTVNISEMSRLSLIISRIMLGPAGIDVNTTSCPPLRVSQWMYTHRRLLWVKIPLIRTYQSRLGLLTGKEHDSRSHFLRFENGHKERHFHCPFQYASSFQPLSALWQNSLKLKEDLISINGFLKSL